MQQHLFDESCLLAYVQSLCNSSNYTEAANLAASFLKKKEFLSYIQPKGSTTLSFQTQPDDFFCTFLSIFQKRHKLHSSFLIAWPLECKLQKGEKKHAYWREALHKALLLCIFMQMTGSFIQGSFSRSASRCPLVSFSSLQCAQRTAADEVRDWL